MSEGLNRVMLIGNLVADPELKVVAGGQALMKMRLATSESYNDRNNQRKERTEYHSISMWGKRAEALAKFLSKGARLFVEGSLRTSSYEKDGEKRYKTEIQASNVLFMNARGESERTASRVETPQDTAQPGFDYSGAGDDSEDLPF